MKSCTLLLILTLIASGCATHRQAARPPDPADDYGTICRNGLEETIRDLRASGAPKDDLKRYLSIDVRSAPGMPSLIDYLYDGDPRTPYEASQYVQRWCHEVGWHEPQSPPAAPSRFWPTVGKVAAGVGVGVAVVGLVGLSAAAGAYSNTYTSTHTYKTSRGSKTIRTSCYYGRYHSSCTTR